MKNKKLPIILIAVMVSWILISVICMFVDNNFSHIYIIQGIGLGISTNGVILFGISNYYGIRDSLKSKSRNELKNNAKRNILFYLEY